MYSRSAHLTLQFGAGVLRRLFFVFGVLVASGSLNLMSYDLFLGLTVLLLMNKPQSDHLRLAVIHIMSQKSAAYSSSDTTLCLKGITL